MKSRKQLIDEIEFQCLEYNENKKTETFDIITTLIWVLNEEFENKFIKSKINKNNFIIMLK